MATRKKTNVSVAAPKPARYEKGYEFLVKVKIENIAEDWYDTGHHGYSIAYSLGNIDIEGYLDEEELLKLEINANPSVNKQIISEKLKTAQAEVAKLTKELAALK